MVYRHRFRALILLSVERPTEMMKVWTQALHHKFKQRRKVIGEGVPSFKTSWKISPEQPCRNFLVLNSEMVAGKENACKSVLIPAEIASLVGELHKPENEETEGIVSKMFAPPLKRYTYGSFFRVHPDQWAIFWDPERVLELTTLTVQSFICAALNSRRRLVFVLGVAANSKLIEYCVSLTEALLPRLNSNSIDAV
ncbi:hypothetical protein GCK32_012867, partial [Trichostrongylus colubriformis]